MLSGSCKDHTRPTVLTLLTRRQRRHSDVMHAAACSIAPINCLSFGNLTWLVLLTSILDETEFD